MGSSVARRRWSGPAVPSRAGVVGRGLQSARAHRHPHPRVPTRRVRRCRGPRRLPRPGTGEAWPTSRCTAWAILVRERSPTASTSRSSRAPTLRSAPSPPTWRWPTRPRDCDIVHSHTWYANMGGHLAKLLHDIPHVVTSHSLEPHRPWKAEQLGGGYRVCSWAERTAYEAADAVIAVSNGSTAGRDRVVPEPRRGQGARRPQRHRHRLLPTPTPPPTCSSGSVSISIDRRRSSSAASPARRASRTSCAPRCNFDESAQLVLLAGAADTPELKAETDEASPSCRAAATACSLVSEMLPREEVRQVLTHSHGVRLPVRVRAARHRQPRGDGMRDGGRGERRRRHPRGGRRGETGLLVHYDAEATRPTSSATSPRRSTRSSRPRPRAGHGRRRPRSERSTEFGWDAAADKTMDDLRVAALTGNFGSDPADTSSCSRKQRRAVIRKARPVPRRSVGPERSCARGGHRTCRRPGAARCN